MLPVDKRLIVSIVDRNGGCYTMNCLHEFYFEGPVMYADMQKLRICVDAAKENPLHLDMGMPVKGPPTLPLRWPRRLRRSPP